VSAKVWNVSPNISSAYNNNFIYFSYAGANYDMELPDGLYGIDELNVLLKIYFSNDETLPNDLFELGENGATQKLAVEFNYSNVTIDFSRPQACIDVTGFYTTYDEENNIYTSDKVITSDIAGETIIAPNEANFNRVVNYYISSNLLSDGIPINNKSSGVICEVPITVRSGSLINFIPTNPLRVDCSDLIGNGKQLVSFALVDQLGRDVSTSGEDWSLALVIRYHSR
jgi:hypothetical protein